MLLLKYEKYCPVLDSVIVLMIDAFIISILYLFSIVNSSVKQPVGAPTESNSKKFSLTEWI
ncbi:hypothetical protein DZC72_09570 [Maribacter algicola]|uniref:Uncharacterized protein n=1 Tax=Maribacter algicola TaxID=2498892 RepID=A0A3R8RY26_9FLAO|nr:hypothetical protein DZC72_09570 [Maribacter algicola]